MGCMLRSEKLTFCEMYLQPETAFHIMSQLGDEGCIQFEDMTPNLNSFQRRYTTDLCRCAELERILNFIKGEIKKEKLVLFPQKGEPAALKPEEMNSLESLLEKWDENIRETSKYQTKLLQNQEQLQQMFYVLKNIDPIIGHAEIRKESLLKQQARSHYGGGGEKAMEGKLHVLTGVVKRQKAYALELMLWRISRGNIFFRPANMDQLFEDPVTGTMVRKVAFLAVCQGTELRSLLEKICAAFHANIYECPPTYSQRQEMIDQLQQRLSDLSQVIQKSKYHRCSQLRQISKNLEGWVIRIKKAKAIYFYMNHFSNDITRKCLIGQCWIPTADLQKVQKLLSNARVPGSKIKSFVTKVDTVIDPPTYHRTNKFTRGFQALISAYGVSVYGELNPGLRILRWCYIFYVDGTSCEWDKFLTWDELRMARSADTTGSVASGSGLYTIITFPFLFAIMFGDCGHGSIMLTFSTWMVLFEKRFMSERSSNEIWNIVFGGRYVILMMSMFSMYTGFIYNDWFSKPLHLKQNYWLNVYSPEMLSAEAMLQLDPAGKTGQRYMLGVDPAWGFAKNKIMNENSLKMKLSIIIGIIHMMFGLWLNFFNHLYFKKYYAVILEFIPQLLILTCLFVWLIALIFFKWVMYGPKQQNIKLQPTCAPSILLLFIDMCLFRKTKVEDGSECDPYMFDGQDLVQKILLLVALANIPILLFGSPLYLLIANKKKKVRAVKKLNEYIDLKKRLSIDATNKVQHQLAKNVERYSESFGNLMIHQGVYTIEYVLSTISHTASYLRLWALSLAHGQLSEMLWIMVLSKLALKDHTWIGVAKLYVVFAIWASFSLSILVVMEGLSAFLHTLRLHWVEFMSKFFIGGGEVFQPYSFNTLVYGDNKEEKAMEASCKKGKSGRK